jgi:hypothetical protein
MKQTAKILLILLAVFCLTCIKDGACSDKPQFTKHFSQTLFNITDKGLFSVEILMDDKEYAKLGKGVIGLVIHNQSDEDVEGAEIRITAVMPEGRAGTDAPAVKDIGDGLYTVSGINLKKEGKWDLKIEIKKKKQEDGASFRFPDVLNNPVHTGKYSAD